MKNIDKRYFLENINNIEVKQAINKFLDGLISMDKSNKNIFFSNFLSPIEFRYAIKIVNNLDLNYDVIFPEDEYERNIIVIYSYDYDINSFIEVLRIEDIEDIEHRNILGGILHLGISREKVGEILKFDGYWYVYFLKPIGEFVFSEGLSYKKRNLKIEKLDDFYLIKNFRKYVDERIIVPSSRLDTFVKEICKTSREVSKKYIKSGIVKLNYEETKSQDKKILENDIISIRGYGKYRVHSFEGITRKEKMVVILKRYEI